MSQPFSKYLMFENRLQKVYRHLSKQAARQGITCYRVYDHDLPEFPFILEKFDDKVYVAEYKRRHSFTNEEHDEWLSHCKKIIARVLEVQEKDIYVRIRQRKEGRQGQYQKIDEEKNEFIVEESGLKFIVNLSDYLDTGLFLDHRITRGMVRDISAGKSVLNLFCYTGSFSVYAAAGGAKQVTSVDLSKTYLDWANRNMQLNFSGYSSHQIVHADVIQYLKSPHPETYDIIVMDPPTFSNSKRMDGILDIQRDHVALIGDCMRLLSPGGSLFFSTNYSRFEFDYQTLNRFNITDITKLTTPFDFSKKLHRFCFLIKNKAPSIQ